MSTMWIGPDESLSVGDVGFLIEISNDVQRYERWVLRDTPAAENQSRRPRLHGWCGSYNGTSTNAHGMGKVVRTAKNGRAQVVSLTGDDLAQALDCLGYPDLA